MNKNILLEERSRVAFFTCRRKWKLSHLCGKLITMQQLLKSQTAPSEDDNTEQNIPVGDGAIPQQPVNKLLSHNAVGVGPQPVPVVLKLHPSVVVADLLPQLLQLGRILQEIFQIQFHCCFIFSTCFSTALASEAKRQFGA